MATLIELDALIDANPDAARGIAAAYDALIGGVPTIDGFVFLINNAVTTNFGSGNPSIVFNQENIFINLANALVQGNPAAAAGFAAITAGAATLQDQLTAIYDAFVPTGSQSTEGRTFFARSEAQTFYLAVAAERGVAGPDGAGIVALASLLKILVAEDTGIGDDVNDLVAAINDGSAQLPENGPLFTPIEDADGNNFDADDTDGIVIDLTSGSDTLTGTVRGDVFNGEVEQTALIPIQTLNNTDNLDGGDGYDVLNAQLVTPLTIPAGLDGIEEINIANAPGFITPAPTLDVINADSLVAVGFRMPGVDATIVNVTTALQLIRITDGNSGNMYSISHTGTALSGAADAVEIELNNVPNSVLTIQNAGYETATVNSIGSVDNFLTLQASFETILVTGTRSLGMNSSALDIGPLDLLDASAFAGAIFNGTFQGSGDLTVEGSEQQDFLNFSGVNGASTLVANMNGGDDFVQSSFLMDSTISGDAGDDTFGFLFDAAGNSSFTLLDSVDGGEGDDTLAIVHSGAGVFLSAGVGANIVNVENILHNGAIAALGNDLTVNMAESGSATTLILNGDYGGVSITTINNLNSDDTIEIDSDFDYLFQLNLNYQTAASDNAFSVELIENERIDDLNVQAGAEIVNIRSSGDGTNRIEDVLGVQANLVLSGDTSLVIGGNGAYQFDNGTVDATAGSGSVFVYTGLGNQTILDGAGNDSYYLRFNTAAARDVVNLSGGDYFDRVTLFEAGSVAQTVANTHLVNGFTLGDTILISTASFLTDFDATDGSPVVNGTPVVMDEVGAGEILNFTGSNVNFLKFTSNTATGVSADALLTSALGAGVLTTDAAGPDLLAAVYDQANAQMVLFQLVDTVGIGQLTAADDALPIVAIAMSYDDFMAFSATNIAFD